MSGNRRDGGLRRLIAPDRVVQHRPPGAHGVVAGRPLVRAGRRPQGLFQQAHVDIGPRDVDDRRIAALAQVQRRVADAQRDAPRADGDRGGDRRDGDGAGHGKPFKRARRPRATSQG